ncbi:ABC transporter transmembrane domain-containing protein, partial [Phaeovulum sp.]|uniref:ABC transporter transmembrane domain-containing protein n=1 Tax=Phaeovulum sp. TaxID=2934796 RepID=UPI0035643086
MNTTPQNHAPDIAELMRHTSVTGWRDGLGTIARVVRIDMQSRWSVAIALVSTLIAASMQLLIPRLLGRAIDQTQLLVSGAEESAARSALLATALLVLLVSVLRGVFTTLQNYFSESVGHHTGYVLRLAYYEKIQNLSFGFHDRVHSGDLITLGMLDLEGVRMFFSTGLVRIVLLSILIGIGGYMLLSTDLLLGLMALSFVPFVAWRSSVTQLTLRG